MREEILNELKKRINDFYYVAKPDTIEHGMTGSFVRFLYSLDFINLVTREEFFSNTYDDFLENEHLKLFEAINGKPL